MHYLEEVFGYHLETPLITDVQIALEATRDLVHELLREKASEKKAFVEIRNLLSGFSLEVKRIVFEFYFRDKESVYGQLIADKWPTTYHTRSQVVVDSNSIARFTAKSLLLPFNTDEEKLALLMNDPDLLKVEELNGFACGIDLETLNIMLDPQKWTNLRTLKLGSNRLGPKIVRILINSGILPQLEILALEGNNLTNVDRFLLKAAAILQGFNTSIEITV